MSCYADRSDVFDEAVNPAEVPAVHAVAASFAARDEGGADNLEVALLSGRTLGAALGILMERCKLTRDEAWARLQA